MFSKQVWEEQEEAERPFRASIDRRQAGRGRRNRKRVGATGDGGDVGSGSGGGERLPKSPSAGGVPRPQLPVSGTPAEGEGPPAAAPGEATSSSEASEAFVLRDASGHFVEPIDFSEAASASNSRFNPATEVARGAGQGPTAVVAAAGTGARPVAGVVPRAGLGSSGGAAAAANLSAELLRWSGAQAALDRAR